MDSVRLASPITRREWLRATLVLAGSGLLAACGSGAAPPSGSAALPSTSSARASASASASAARSSPPAAGSGAASAATSSGPAASKHLAKTTILEGGRVISWAPAYVALGKGYFKDNGVDVDYETSARGTTEAISAVLGGSSLITFTGSPAQLTAIQKGSPLRIVLVASTEYGVEITASNQLMNAKHVTPQSPLQEKVEALKGAKIGIYVPGDSTDQFARVLFRKYNINADADVTLVSTGTAANMLSAFERGSIDVMAVSPPTGEQGEKAGKGKVFIKPSQLTDIKGYPYLTGAASLSGIQSKSKELLGIVKAMAQAERYIKQDPNGAKTVVRTFFKNFDQQVFDLSYEAMLAAVPNNPIPTQDDYNALVNFTKLLGKPLTLPYDKLIDPSLAQQAVKELGG